MKNKQVYLLTVLLLILNMNKSLAQQDPQFGHYMYNQVAYNPGAAGRGSDVLLTGDFRNEFVGFDGAPLIVNFNASAPFKLFGKNHGVALNIIVDELGFYESLYAQLSYAYKASVAGGSLGIGASIGAAQRGFSDNKILAQSEPTTQQQMRGPNGNDPNLTITGRSDFDVSAGLFYETDDIFLGLSTTHIKAPEFNFSVTGADISELSDELVRVYYINAGYFLQLKNPAFELFPSVLLTSDAQTSKVDASLSLIYNKKFSGGLTYSPGVAVTGLIGFEFIKDLKVGISYDFVTNDLSQLGRKNNEIFLQYSFTLGVEKAPKRYKSIRYL